MATSKSNQRAVNKYVKNKYDRINVVVPKGHLAEIKAYAAKQGGSVNAFINRAVNEAMGQGLASQYTDEARSPEGGGTISPKSLEAAERGAEATGENIDDFLYRAIMAQIQRDALSFQMGTNPATGELTKEKIVPLPESLRVEESAPKPRTAYESLSTEERMENIQKVMEYLHNYEEFEEVEE